jgi:hypothetical protein
MPARVPAQALTVLSLTLAALLSGCAADPVEERETAETTAVTVPDCAPAAKGSPGECAANDDSDALLEQYVAQCAFGTDAVSRDWTEDFGWIWWNPAQPGTTAALGVEVSTGNVVCT